MRLSDLVKSAAALSALAAGPALAEEMDVGEFLYNQYCATCHGDGGTGTGPLTELLTVSPTDLTGLAQANDGVYPMLKVVHVIDGRTGVRAHGGPMPTYGQIFMEDSDTGLKGDYSPVLMTRGRVMSLALYLESLQK